MLTQPSTLALSRFPHQEREPDGRWPNLFAAVLGSNASGVLPRVGTRVQTVDDPEGLGDPANVTAYLACYDNGAATRREALLCVEAGALSAEAKAALPETKGFCRAGSAACPSPSDIRVWVALGDLLPTAGAAGGGAGEKRGVRDVGRRSGSSRVRPKKAAHGSVARRQQPPRAAASLAYSPLASDADADGAPITRRRHRNANSHPLVLDE